MIYFITSIFKWLCIMCFATHLFVVSIKTNITESIDDLNSTILRSDGTLLLNIKWKAKLKNGTNLDVIISPRGESCSNKPCSEYGLPGIVNEITFPREIDQYIEYGQCNIEPGCSYFVRVTTEKRHLQKNQTIHVPGDCYLGICSCRHGRDLPRPEVSAGILDSNALNISWSIPPLKVKLLEKNISLHSVFLSISQGDTPSLTWGGKQNSIFNHFYPLNSTTYNTASTSRFHFNLSTKLIPGSYYIRAHTIDARGCKSWEGTYTLSVRAPKNESRQLPEETSSHLITLIIPMIIAAIVIFCVVNYVYKHTCKVKPTTNWHSIYRNPPPSGINQISMEENLLYLDKDILDAQEKGKADIFEVPFSCLIIAEEIGKGAFGRVYKATAHNLLRIPGTTLVAVKQLKKRPTTDEVEEFLGEIQTMKDVGRHENVVALLGCCTIKEPLTMIMEYVGHGDLHKYLHNVRKKHLETFRIPCTGMVSTGEIPVNNNMQPPRGKYLELRHSMSTISSDASYIKQPDTQSTLRPSVTETMYTMLSQNSTDSMGNKMETLDYVVDNAELHNFALQIAKGMRHLEERGITHRDLAARNVLIDAHKTLKISDFGLSRAGIYVNTKTKKLPLRWLSIEAIRDNLYSSSSDVWAFAVVLWEIGTLGGFPYPTVNNHEILGHLAEGKRLERPEICSESLYKLMMECWREDPEQRPSFVEIVKYLQPQNQKIYVDFSTLGADYVFPPTREQILENRSGQDEVKV